MMKKGADLGKTPHEKRKKQKREEEKISGDA